MSDFRQFLFLALLFSAGGVLANPGVVLRFDDAHPVEQWKELAAAFDAEGLKASFAVPMANVKTPEQAAFLREAVANGHEIMDHACHHGVFYDICRDAAEFAAACKLPCVAEVDEKDRFVGFRFAFDRTHSGNRTFRGAITNGVLVVAPEEAKRLRRPNKVFVPSLNRFFGFFDAPDGRIQLYSFYRPQKLIRGIDVPEGELLLCDHRAFTVCEGALRYQAALSRDAFRRCGLPDPKVWIQPGGWEPWVPVDLFRKTYAKEFGYTAADCIPGSGPWNGDPKAADPEIARYTFRPGTFFDSPSVTQDGIRKTILAARDVGRGLCFLSHMKPSPKMKGGWSEWMSETRALLKWLRENDIPVRTMSAMADHLWGRKGRGFRPDFGGVTFDFAAGTRPGPITVSLDYGGKPIARPVSSELLMIPEIAARVPERYMNGCHPGRLVAAFASRASDRVWATTLAQCGARVVLMEAAGAPRIGAWREAGITRALPQVFGILQNAYWVSGAKNAPAEDRFVPRGDLGRFGNYIANGICPKTVIEERPYFTTNLAARLAKAVAGGDGTAVNWEPGMFRGRG